MAAATYSDVAVALGRPIATSEERGQIEFWLSGVEMFIAARFAGTSHLDQNALRYVETEAVRAKVGRGLESSISVTLDDGTVTKRYEGVKAEDITEAMWNLLDPTYASSADAFTISPYRSRQAPVGDGGMGF